MKHTLKQEKDTVKNEWLLSECGGNTKVYEEVY